MQMEHRLMENSFNASIGVFCSSKPNIPKHFLDFSFQLGEFLAKNNLRAVYGGGNTGMMQQLAKGVYSANGNILAITTQFFIHKEGLSEHSGNHVICDNILERKKLLIESSDLLCYLPGGFGTLDELMTAIMQNNESTKTKPIIIVDIMNYYSPFLNWLEQLSFMNAIDKPSEQFSIARSMNDIAKILLPSN